MKTLSKFWKTAEREVVKNGLQNQSGNSIVMKPASDTPMGTLTIAKFLPEAGVSPKAVQRVMMELGENDPLIVFADANSA